jgi:hypothetical protein
MNNFRILVLIFVLSSGCNENNDKKKCDQTIQICTSSTLIPQEGDDDVPEIGVPYEALSFNTNLALVDFNSEQQDKIIEASELIRRVVATEEFKNAVLNHSYNGVKTFVENQGLTNAQIYNKFLQGAEKLTPARNNTMDVEVALYYENTSTIGYTYASTKRIWMNTKYFNNYTASQVASNLTHEWMHKLGFTHAVSYNTSRSYSVPYAVGYIILKLIPQVVQQN